MSRTVAEKLLAAHALEGGAQPGAEIALRIDQTLTQDATGTLVMLELEAIGLERTRAEVSAQYVDHNLVQADHRNPDDHLFLHSACRRFGIWYSPAGNGISHPLHQQRFGRPGASLLGADSHTCASGALGMLAIGTGGLEVAMAMAGEPFRLVRPEVFGVNLRGRLPDWVSAKDVVLEMLRRHGVSGAQGFILEYHGPGVAELSIMDRHVIANMGAELGATTTVFPSDEETRRFLERHGRERDWSALAADEGARYAVEDELDLAALEPLIALPSSPGSVVPVREVAGREIYQAYLGSSANPGFRDYAVAAEIVRGKSIPAGVSLDVNPATRLVLRELAASGHLEALLAAGARLHQAGCNGCIGMGQAPATGRISLRTVPRNFPGRSGTREDQVYLCSPETAAASALHGRITDPRELAGEYPRLTDPAGEAAAAVSFDSPLAAEEARAVELVKGPNIHSLPELLPLGRTLEPSVLLVLGDDVSTDEILPAGARVLPFRSNLEKLARFTFVDLDPGYAERAMETRGGDGHVIVAGRNYGQGSSREHAALAPRYLGLRAVLALGFARIHRQNLINFGVLPLYRVEGASREPEPGDRIEIWPESELPDEGREFALPIRNLPGQVVRVRHDLSPREREVLRAGGRIPSLQSRDGRPGVREGPSRKRPASTRGGEPR